MLVVCRQDKRSDQRQLNQEADPAEQPDIERHRENRFEPAFLALPDKVAAPLKEVTGLPSHTQ